MMMRRVNSKRRRGFTLLELMVALTITSILVLAIVSLGSSSSRFFNEQLRIGQLQGSVRSAMARFGRDAARAGFMSIIASNAINARMCPTMSLATPVNAVDFTDSDPDGTSALNAVNGAENRVSADRIGFVGNFSTSDGYLARGINGSRIFLQTNWQAFRRSFHNDAGIVDVAHFRQVFQNGRTLHLLTKEGFHMFTTITDANATGLNASITVNPPIPIPSPCINGDGSGVIVAPVTRVEYSIRTAPAGSPGASRNPAVTGANTQLIRSEFDVLTNTPVGTPRVVLNYAVDFNVDFILDNSAGPPAIPTLVRSDGPTAAAAMSVTPWQARSLIVSLAARTPEQDPRFPWPIAWAGGRPTTAPLNRYRFANGRPGAARVRSLQTEIMLPNLVP